MNNLRNFPPVTLGIFQSTLLQEEQRFIFQGLCNYIFYFNPRSYKRSDLNLFDFTWSPCYFNPRSYKKSDLFFSLLKLQWPYFNPRSYKRSDCLPESGMRLNTRFQSTLLQEERRASVHIPFLRLQFQSTLLQEERQVFVPLLLIFQYFNPRSYKRSDVYLPHDRRRNNYFNPRSYKRSD